MSRQRLTDAQWRDLVAEHQASGLDVASFCQRRGLAISTFFARRRRLERPEEYEDGQEGLAAPRFIEVTTVRDAPHTPDGVSGVEGAEEAKAGGRDPSIELVLRYGVVVRVHEGFDAALLRRVVEVLS